MTLLSKTLPPAQEADIVKKVAIARRLEFPKFAAQALQISAFCTWFRRRYVAEPVLEKITPDMREPFLIEWERDLRDTALTAMHQAELDALPYQDNEATEPYDALPMTRAGGVQHAREDDDGMAIDRRDDSNDDDDSGDEDLDPPPAPSIAPPSGPFTTEPPSADAPMTLRDGRIFAGGVFFESKAEYDAYLLECEEGVAEFAAYEARKANQYAGVTLADDNDIDGEPAYLIAKLIPAAPSLTILYGLREAGKSLLAQKAAVVVGSDYATFDGTPTAHGAVLYVSLDSGARQRQVKHRMRLISDALGVPYSDRVVIVHDAVNLLDPLSVAALLARHPGPWAMVVLDPLFKFVGGGDLSHPSVMVPTLDAAQRIAIATGAAVLVVTHAERKDLHSYGSVFQDNDADCILHAVRHFKGQSGDGDRMTVTWDKLKNDHKPEHPAEYRFAGALIAGQGDAKGAVSASPAPTERPDVLALLATKTATTNGLFARLNATLLLDGKPQMSNEKAFQRLCHDWRDAGLVEYNGKRRTIRRKA